ncbi:Thiol-disulfide isomerase or thioredoxin [Singulisphaera sp. GP187]|uniref:TlpA family protein disulfide reductase n=1 Tax=Singulisphaera sp. GP187 TaxID=1882752 RepID=UPI000928E597|nr:TlpA disulfide reductase family protein [Singulisphaera sp. GP187]SIO08884.1 Thiol-disulfide isomerase or thioredoxin [Singulisphaera sp. GP187]
MNESKPTPARTWLIVTASLATAWIVFLLLFGPRSGSGNLSVPELKAPIPASVAAYGWSLHDLAGGSVPLEKYQGKTIFLNVWATWCPPCVAELPAIANLAGNPRLKDVAFLCVSTDESPEVVRSFLKGKNWPMTILMASDIPPAFATEGIPATFVIAPDGRVVVSEVGSAQWDDPSVVDFLEKLSTNPTGALKNESIPAAESPADTAPPR